MAISDPVTLGATATATDDQATYTHVTTAVVPAGAKIIVGVAWMVNGAPGTITVSGGGLSGWAQDHRVIKDPVEPALEIWSAEAPSGLSSGVTITADPSSASIWGCHIHACYVEGTADTAYVDDTAGAIQGGTGTWATGALDTTGEGVGISLAFADGVGATGTNTPDGNTTELSDAPNASDEWVSALCYRRRADAGTVAMGGTYNTNPVNQDGTCAVAYKASTEGPPQQLRPDGDIVTTGWSTAPLWSKIEEESADGTVITATAS